MILESDDTAVSPIDSGRVCLLFSASSCCVFVYLLFYIFTVGSFFLSDVS